MPESDQPPLLPLDYENPRNPPPRNAPWLLWGCLTTILLLIAGSFVFQRIDEYEQRRLLPRIASQSILQQIGEAIGMYADKHPFDYPDSLATLFSDPDIIAQHYIDPSIIGMPATGSANPPAANQTTGWHFSYIYLGCGLNKRTVPPQMVVAYEKPAHASDGAVMLFGDGHVEYENAAGVADILAHFTPAKFPATNPSP